MISKLIGCAVNLKCGDGYKVKGALKAGEVPETWVVEPQVFRVEDVTAVKGRTIQVWRVGDKLDALNGKAVTVNDGSTHTGEYQRSGEVVSPSSGSIRCTVYEEDVDCIVGGVITLDRFKGFNAQCWPGKLGKACVELWSATRSSDGRVGHWQAAHEAITGYTWGEEMDKKKLKRYINLYANAQGEGERLLHKLLLAQYVFALSVEEWQIGSVRTDLAQHACSIVSLVYNRLEHLVKG